MACLDTYSNRGMAHGELGARGSTAAHNVPLCGALHVRKPENV